MNIEQAIIKKQTIPVESRLMKDNRVKTILYKIKSNSYRNK